MAGIVITAAIISFLTYENARRRTETNASVTAFLARIEAYNDAQVAVLLEGGSVAGYYTLGDEAFVQDLADARVRFDEALARAEALLLEDDENGRRRLADVRQRHEKVADTYATVVTTLRGLTPAEIDLFEPDVNTVTESIALFDLLEEEKAQLGRELERAQREEGAAQTNSTRVGYAVAAIWALLACAILVVVEGSVMRPLREVGLAVRRVARGAVDVRVPVRGPRELRRLTNDINTMADSLVQRSDELNAYLSKDLERRTAELERSHTALASSERRFRALIQNASDLVTVVGSDLTVRYQSPSIRRVLGHTPERVEGAMITDFLHPQDIDALQEFLKQPGGVVRFRMRGADGCWHHCEAVGTDQTSDPELRGFVLNIRDVTEQQTLTDTLRRQAFTDALTGLPNRAAFRERLGNHASRFRLALLFVDLDDFKAVNDTLGHEFGDFVLRQAGARIAECVGSLGSVARLGGDEFAILLEDQILEGPSIELAQSVLATLARPYELEERHVVCGASIGIALSPLPPPHDRDRDLDLLRHADVALYAAKEKGPGQLQVFESNMHRAFLDRMQLMKELDGAVERGEFVVHYEPIIRLANGDTAGSEALVRWNHPTRGLLMPGQFIPLAEESGAIESIGNWVLARACNHLAQMNARRGRPHFISVNVSPRQLHSAEFVRHVQQALQQTAISPHKLILELTESAVIGEHGASSERLQQLKHLGVRLAIDDFGTGYSSLSYLQKLPFDIVKIDRSFLTSMEDTANGAALVDAIIGLTKSLNLEVVAEGIERPEQLVSLRNANCDYGQGYLFPSSQFEAEVLAA